eukprot:CAMPEP_0201282056 /NCGR_PEP_ID=MMETSP1317-20130820/4748_1 /ASSEMBLY_ACC=CAM_ASM_000770 /TAXON_ID=187299 /ORGANISM="Undescribed Undescribed, Strain Undescribed" /LENGTH=67 /DNA_ID=CAMNT_0047593737 /DNA_START=144 /DNA_END=344 /DNA_ORIENTATION=+
MNLEVVKFIQAFFIEQDDKMYHEENDIPCKAQAMNIHEDLGCIDYIFADKTGTLTANVLEFKRFCCA